ncbi:site-specific DNA recombinase [Clostridium acidisoli DSM 12555]|uniref:Site-specific DNA recombinase n=1 Tax=Clostridium acidisoli DSM 12555 TaxID=1121291 RepID=A0A1W1X010_9CLOT|nr:recombinase family protein [Clostridium acidisoli]SMC17316.1 site-specific DNA recombinase [Clostridium acidisoli DSM 12555]
MKAAIYSRKSKFTGKGESIENQIELCKNYALNLGITEFIVYEDEGFSGKNIDRPNFQKLLSDARERKFDTIICYRLDRISRNIADFSSLINELQDLGLGFISIREQFDTTTPMGRAMMYIASVFAQLERETIAERVRDNMLELAKTGRWLGGQTPLGFKSEAISYFDSEMNEKKMFKLSPENEELKIVNLIYDKYLEFKSLSQVTKYLTQNMIKSKTGNTIWNKRTVQDVLTNPAYVKADDKVLSFFKDQGITVAGNADKKHGILTYNKKKGTKSFRDTDEWIAAISKHLGVIESYTWLKVQNTLAVNKEKAPRMGKTNNVLLTGILKCHKCGSSMKVIHGRTDKDGKKIFYYKCSLKEASGNKRCDNSNVRADELEKVLIKKIEEISSDKGLILKELKAFKENLDISDTASFALENTQKNIKNKKSQIENLVDQLSLNPSISEYIIPQINTLDKEIKALKLSENEIKDTKNDFIQSDMNIDLMLELLKKVSIIDSLDVEEKKLVLNSILDEVTWDGDTGNIDITLWGMRKKKVKFNPIDINKLLHFSKSSRSYCYRISCWP